jgi:pyridinium-3,5-bisthiocarboxylic acid mononucleotide nickel chelatase
MKVAYFDCPTGVSGDMCLGALLDAGVPIEYLTQHLNRLGIEQEYTLTEAWVNHNGQRAKKAIVTLKKELHSHDHSHENSHEHSYEHPHDHSHENSHEHSHEHSHEQTRTLPTIETMIESANLPKRSRDWSLAVFRNLAIAEGAVHGIPPEQVHFHEVGAVDAIVDIVGTCLGLDWLDIDAFYCSALPTGGGTVWAAHGRLPVPVPAVLKLLETAQVPVFYNNIDRELVTPTGAAIVITLAHHFGHPPNMALHKVALGAGTISLPIPNILRLWIGDTRSTHTHTHTHTHSHSHSHSTSEPSTPHQTIVHLETQLDDLSPQAIAYTTEKLFSSGALDVFTTAIGMKKSRPGTLINVICAPDQAASCEQILFEETTTLGIRRSVQQRTALARSFETVQIQDQTVHLKIARDGDRIVNVQPEYEDCAAIARQSDRPLQAIQQQALSLWRSDREPAQTPFKILE